MAKRGERVDPNHHMGKQTGYTLIEGVYHIAPLYQDRMRMVTLQRVGIEEMLAIVTAHASKDLEQIAETSQRIWDDIIDDIGLDKAVKWQYYNGLVSRQEAQKKGG